VDRWWPHYSPFMTEEDLFEPGVYVPLMALPSRSAEPLRAAEYRCAMATAAHELTHVFNSVERPLRLGNGSLNEQAESWRWFNEGMAVFMESKPNGMSKNRD
jgi:hypothetical protein